jgi:hypothetical protein
MPKRTKLDRAAKTIVRALRSSGTNIYSQKTLAEFFYGERKKGVLAQHTTLNDFLEFMTDNSHLVTVTLLAESYDKSITRYCLNKPSPFELATSIQKSGYLSHGTAAHLHRLINSELPVLYLNVEQSAKPTSHQPLTQIAIDRAFSGKQRLSNLVYKHQGLAITMLSGKNTGRLGVENIFGPNYESVPVTNLERTLIDVTVRPLYAGGITSTLDAYRSAKGRMSTSKLVEILEKLHYIYPYAQAIGFLMERAGYPESEYSQLKAGISKFDFYLTHGMKNPRYDETWRLHYPASMQ